MSISELWDSIKQAAYGRSPRRKGALWVVSDGVFEEIKVEYFPNLEIYVDGSKKFSMPQVEEIHTKMYNNQIPENQW